MTTDPPSDLEISGASMRGIVSLELPAGKGTTRTMGLSGYSALAIGMEANVARDAAAATQNALKFMIALFVVLMALAERSLKLLYNAGKQVKLKRS